MIPVTEDFLNGGEELGIDDIGLDHQGYIEDQLQHATKVVKDYKQRAQELREEFLEERAEQYALEWNTSQEQAVRAIKKKEALKRSHTL